MDSNLNKLSKPIIAKFKRMNSDTESIKSPLTSCSSSTKEKSYGGEYRKKRAAALSAQSIWRTELVDSLPTTTMNLRNHQRNNNFLDVYYGENLPGTSGLSNKDGKWPKSKNNHKNSSDSSET